jgi:hypothetical protein
MCFGLPLFADILFADKISNRDHKTPTIILTSKHEFSLCLVVFCRYTAGRLGKTK